MFSLFSSMHQDATGYVCLLIQPAKKSDAGWYTLSAKNEAGIVSCTARLDIYGRWNIPVEYLCMIGSLKKNVLRIGIVCFHN